MAGYPLTGLLRIRDFRLDAAQQAQCAAEAALQSAIAEKEEKARELARYKKWRVQEVERRYARILMRKMTMEALDKFKAGLSQLADEELAREGEILEADKRLVDARNALNAARTAFTHANQAREKILYHRDVWRQEEAKETARAEDREMEEFKPLVFVEED
ncbi:MAG: type III secretion protein [Zoogloeaceae bacterium]|jgi:type III secretion protein O|nr:type III secretion protein [Zoogloeaceae bacterium]